jgi:hypothetical protein
MYRSSTGVLQGSRISTGERVNRCSTGIQGTGVVHDYRG